MYRISFRGGIALSRRSTGPQRKKRNRPFDPLKHTTGYQRPHKPSIWSRLFHNRWIVFGGMGVIALGTIFGSICGAQLGDSSATSTTRQQAIRETATPEGTPTGTPDPNRTPTPTPSPTPTPPQRQYSAPPPLTIDESKQYFVTLKTEKGDVRLELFPKDAPQTVNNFVFLARNDFYDGLTFHRVIENFVAQGGDPTGQGAGNPGYNLPDERNSLRHEAGVIAMAKAGTTTSGSQFYITYAPQPNLDQQGFTVFGKVVSGMDVLRQLTPRDTSRNPRAPAGDRILDVVVEER